MFQNLTNRFQALPAGGRDAVACLLLALAVFAVYANVYHGDFIFDDVLLISRNQYLRDWRHLPDIFTHLNYAGAGMEGAFYRPVEMLLRLALYQLFGLSKPAFHAVNVLLQALNAGLIYWLGRKLGFAPGAVFSAALLWSVHPLHTQNIALMSSTAEPLWTAFGLMGLLAFVYRDSAAILFFLLALGCKETAIVFPALAVACLFISSDADDRLKPALYARTWPFWLLLAVYAVTYMHFNDFHPFKGTYATFPDLETYAANIFSRLLTCLATLPAYLGLIVYPTNLHMERVFPVFTSVFSWQVLAGAALAAGALAQIILGKGKRGLFLSFGLFWFAAALSPLTGILIPIDYKISEGWMYVPLIGLFLGVAQTLAVWIGGMKSKTAPVIAAAAVALMALLFGIKTYSQNDVYQTPATFYENILRCGGYHTRAYQNLGNYYWKEGEFDKAIESYKLAFKNPDQGDIIPASLHYQIALAYLRVTLDENYVPKSDSLMEALPQVTHIPEAVDELNQALKADPGFEPARALLGAINDWQAKRMFMHPAGSSYLFRK